MSSGLLFTTSPWFTVLCVAVGALYAWALYATQAPSWGRNLNLALAFLRALLVAVICFLLLGPRVRNIETSVERAKVVLAIDDSESMKTASNTTEAFSGLRSGLGEAGYEVSTMTLSGRDNPDSISYDLGTTDLTAFLNRIRSNFEGENLSDVVLLTDGTVNQGSSPIYGAYPFKIHTVAVGDTVPARDIRITNVRANQVAFLGNRFPVQADISAYGMGGRQATLTLRQGQRVLASKAIRISGDQHFETAEFMVASAEKGMQRFTLELSVLNGERTQEITGGKYIST